MKLKWGVGVFMVSIDYKSLAPFQVSWIVKSADDLSLKTCIFTQLTRDQVFFLLKTMQGHKLEILKEYSREKMPDLLKKVFPS
jgi:hypothetical protein